MWLELEDGLGDRVFSSDLCLTGHQLTENLAFRCKGQGKSGKWAVRLESLRQLRERLDWLALDEIVVGMVAKGLLLLLVLLLLLHLEVYH